AGATDRPCPGPGSGRRESVVGRDVRGGGHLRRFRRFSRPAVRAVRRSLDRPTGCWGGSRNRL
ncbi:MAG: hypothetical protein AAGM22_03380, partial [Acidobacteriota bacterium]